jgi:hypothetical protein
MSRAKLDALRQRASRRRLAIALASTGPLALAMVALALRVAGMPLALAVALLGVLALAWIGWRATRVDDTWLARRLDALAPVMDDSTALLFRDPDTLATLPRLQHARLQARLSALAVDPRPAWPWRVLSVSAGFALAMLLAIWLWPARERVASVDAGTVAAATAHATQLTHSELTIEPPTYTGLPLRQVATLDAKAPQDARLRWHLRFDPQPSEAALLFHDGSRLALTRNGDDWQGERALPASALYRVALEGAPPLADDRLYRLDAVLDQAPEVRVLQPDKTLNLLDAGQKTWPLTFEASDDYAIARAELSITLAQGGGENIEVKEQTVALTGEPGGTASQSQAPSAGDGRAHPGAAPSPAQRGKVPTAEAGALSPIAPQAATSFSTTTTDGNTRAQLAAVRYSHVLDLAALGFALGDDVIVRLVVTDNRAPQPNTTRSASFILRWPADVSSDSAGLEGIVQRTLPAYFRSQRQIIIDSEALLAEKTQLDEAKFMARSDTLGVDQRILRLRYGQFMGEESETRETHSEADEHADADADDPSTQKTPAATHEHADASTPTKFGEAGNVLAQYGHTHDIAEAATLLDPETKAILKSALAEMWQAELHLRQGDPALALPYEYRALEFVKQVQQSTRIYLARVGLELPAPDEARRLSGKRDGLTDRVGTLVPASGDDTTIIQLWQTLAGSETPDWDAAQTWVAARQATLPDALGVLAALDSARRDRDCTACRARLRALLWPLLPQPAAASAPRVAPDASGRAYLDALHSTAAEDAR